MHFFVFSFYILYIHFLCEKKHFHNVLTSVIRCQIRAFILTLFRYKHCQKNYLWYFIIRNHLSLIWKMFNCVGKNNYLLIKAMETKELMEALIKHIFFLSIYQSNRIADQLVQTNKIYKCSLSHNLKLNWSSENNHKTDWMFLIVSKDDK